MKVYLGSTAVKSMNVHHYEMSTNDATVVASDMQAGVTAYAKGRKVTGTGKSFEFANYGAMETNLATPVPANINVIEVASLTHPVQLAIALSNMKNADFTVEQTVGHIMVDGVSYPLTARLANNRLTITCGRTVTLQVFYGKDNYT